jgi:CRISPR-associated protein Csh2
MVIVNRRSEVLFYYDISNANPNGDPLDENKPRIDEQTGHNLVTDVRLKRTIRDYLMNFKGYDGIGGKDIFVKEIKTGKGDEIQDGKQRAENFGNDRNKILDHCVDIRLFGGVLPLEGASFTYTGPVQFKMGNSLHEVSTRHIKGTGAFASGKGKDKKTFREEHFVDYSFICFAGIINENAAQKTKLTDEDIKLLLEGMWEGTKCLISRSKFGQQPRLLIKVNYKNGFHIGDLDKSIKLVSSKQDIELRSIADFKIDMTEFSKIINEHKDKIESIEIKKDSNLKIEGLNVNIKELII